MSSTRYADLDAPLSQERYMSSPEYVELRGIAANAVTAKAALMGHPTKRSLLFFLQAMSLKPGGLQKFAREFLEMFADRIGTPTMHRVGTRPNQKYDCETAETIRIEMASTGDGDLDLADALDSDGAKDRPKAALAVDCLHACQRQLGNLPGFIIELCINPRLRFTVPGETETAKERERQELEDEFEKARNSGELGRPHYASTALPYFRDIIGALFEYKRRYEESARRDFVMTEVGRQVFDVLDVSLATGKMVVIQGESRIGKTTAAEAWCNQHLGEARFVSLSGILNRTGVFRAIAKALGLASNCAYTATKIQARVEDVLQRSGLVLVIDEAHFLLSATERTRCAPELIDWVNTALCNHRVPCALVCTPQLSIRMARHEHQSGWNADQWRGRVKRFCTLPAIPNAQDLRAVARKLLPNASKPVLDYIVGYALNSKLHMPAVVDVVDEARLLAQREDRREISYEDVERAICNYCAPSTLAMAQTFASAEQRKRGRFGCKASHNAPVVELGGGQESVETHEREISLPPSLGAVAGSRMRFKEPVEALIGEPGNQF